LSGRLALVADPPAHENAAIWARENSTEWVLCAEWQRWEEP
jgi:hypothetical protein